MEKKDRHVRQMLSMVLMAVLTVACVSHDEEQAAPQQSVLNIYVYPSGHPVATRADEGTVEAYSAERAVHSLQLWVFASGSDAADQALYYYSPESNALQSGQAEHYQIPLTNAQATLLAGTKVDVYVLANAASIGLSALGARATRQAVSTAVIDTDYFGVSPLTSDISTQGLPMSGCSVGTSVKGTVPVLSIDEIQLTRCVSKLRLVFTQPDDSEVDFAVNNIQLDGGNIPATEQAFNLTANAYSISANYVAAPFSVAPPPEIGRSTDLSRLVYAGGDPQAYETTIDAAIRTGEATQAGPFYLRESDRRLTGTIGYTADGVAKTASFAMDATSGQYNFSRNHTWTVVCYFSGGRLCVQPTLQPWEVGHDRFHYSTQGSTVMEWNSYLRYDEDRQASTWDDTYVAVAYGYNTGTDVPSRSPRLTLLTTNVNNLILAVNNERFQIVVVEGSTYSKCGQQYVIRGNDQQQATTFYVVPIDDSSVADPYALLTVTAVPTDGMPPFHIPFNHDLPGDEDHTTVRIVNVGAADYQSNMHREKQAGSSQQTNYWMERNE